MELRSMSQVLMGFLATLVSLAIILGSFFLSLAEGGKHTMEAFTPTNSPLPTIQAAGIQPLPVQPTSTFTPTATPTATQPTSTATCLPPVTATATLTLTSTPTDTVTPTPTATSVKRPRPTNTKAIVSCTIASGWVLYTIRAGDTLYSIGQAYGVSAAEIQAGNCMGSNTLIHTGEQIFVPNVQPKKTPKPTIKPTAKPTKTQSLESPIPPPVTTTEAPLPATATEAPVQPPVDTNGSAAGSAISTTPDYSQAFSVIQRPSIAGRFFTPPTQRGYPMMNGFL